MGVSGIIGYLGKEPEIVEVVIVMSGISCRQHTGLLGYE